MQTLKFEVGADGVALLTIDVAGRPMNVLTPELQADLAAAVERIASEPAIKGAVLTSGKANGFIAGADLKDLVTVYGRQTEAEVYEGWQELSRLLRRMETCGKPVAAAINGLALGGGLEVCLGCHYRVLSDSPKAQLGLPEVKVGLLPGGGGTQRLPRLIGIAKALPLMLDGNPLGPQQALALGIVHVVLPEAELVAAARAWVLANPQAQQPWDVKGFRVPGGAGSLAPHAAEVFGAGTSRLVRATRRNYPAPLAISAAVFEGSMLPIDTGLRIESKYFAKLLAGAVARNLTRTLFINKGAADKLERRPAGVPKAKVTKLGVLGAGMMGAGIAQVASAAGIKVVLIDSTQQQAEQGKSRIAAALEKAVAKKQLPDHCAVAQLALVTATTDYAQLAGAELVIEAVFESREIKREVTGKAAAVLGTEAIFASNTSTLPITGLAEAWPRPAQFIGLHFFSPVERMPLVEVILGKQTSQQTLAQALDFVAQLRKTPIVVNDSPGFFTSRVFGTFVDEGMAMLQEGVAPALIENAARLAGMPVGPLAVTDEVTLDLQKKVYDQAVADQLPERFIRRNAQPVVNKMIELGRIGRRAGAGFYEYGETGKQLWTGLAEHFPQAAKQPDVEVLRQRFLSIQAIETARCVEEGVIEHPADADLGSTLGIGYPSWTGGTLSYIETVGLQAFVDQCRKLAQNHGPRFQPSDWLAQRASRGTPFHA
jgi:3-hydroxyacyl-CoA dehydrogenase/enoyl-CoA hydratase/3-hydroxybutyryl-CoA epimerase